jgi:large subunit ribosomal protein L5
MSEENTNEIGKVKENQMREIKIAKIVVNIGCGEAGEKLDRAKRLLKDLVGKDVCTTKTTGRTTFGMPKGRELGTKVILRGEEAETFLKRAFVAVENKISKRVFDKQGNFSFGVKEHIAFPDVRYNPEIGIYGMDVCVVLERRGFRVARKRDSRKIGKSHRISAEQASAWTVEKFGVKLVSKKNTSDF